MLRRGYKSRTQLFKHGTRLMLRSGYAGMGLTELLRRAGVPKGSFYNHFDSKEDFGVEVVQRYYAGHDRLLAALLAETDRSPLERLRSYFDLLLERAVRASPEARGCLLGMLALEMAGSSEPLRATVSDSFRRWEARLAELLRQAQDAGELGPEQDPELAAGMLLQGWEGALMRARVSHDLNAVRNFSDLALRWLSIPRATPQVRSQGWADAFARKSAEAFGGVLADDVVLEASVLRRPIEGRSQVMQVMGTASEVYESLVFTHEVSHGTRSYLEWEATAFGGVVLAGVTILTKNGGGQIVRAAIHHRPLGAALRFSEELRERLAGVVDPGCFHDGDDDSSGKG
jgi:AcrR family transcriptional regulator